MLGLDLVSCLHSWLVWKCVFLFWATSVCSELQGFCPAHYLWEILSSWGIICLPPLRLDWDCSQQVSPKMVLSVENQRLLLTCHRWHVSVMRASPPQSCSGLAVLLEGAVSAGPLPLPQVSPVLCPCSCTHHVWDHRRLQGADQAQH